MLWDLTPLRGWKQCCALTGIFRGRVFSSEPTAEALMERKAHRRSLGNNAVVFLSWRGAPR